MPEDQCIEYILKSQPDDPRSKNWKYKIILDVLQEFDPLNISTLLKEVNNTHKEQHKCDKDLFTYDSLYSTVAVLSSSNILTVNDKMYSVSPEYITTKTKYLPLSIYCIVMWALSVIFLVYTVFVRTMTTEAVIMVATGAVYVFAQMFGVEFDFNNHKLKK